MGVAPYVIVSALSGVVAQRLVRRICPDCAAEYEPTVEEQIILAQHNIRIPPKKGLGCVRCHHTGYKGRTALYEIVVLDEELKRLIIEQRSDSDYRKYLKSTGFKSMFEDGLLKVEQGITTITEVLSVTIGSEV